jgi:hypothetical protein
MKAIIACLICVVAIGCIGFAPSKAEAGWYGRGVGISIGIGPAKAITDTAIVHMATTALAIVHTGTTVTGTDPTDITAIAPIADIGRVVQFVADTGQAVQLVAGSDRFRTSVHFGSIERLVRPGSHFPASQQRAGPSNLR